MLTSHELIGFMSPALGNEILTSVFETDKPTYRAAMNAVAEYRKVRPIFMERQPRQERNAAMLAALSKPALELISANLIRHWLLKKHTPMLVQFLDALGVPHKDGVVDDLPKEMDDAKLRAAVDGLLAKYPAETVAVYLIAFNDMNEVNWPNLKTLLETDSRLQLGSHA